MSAPKRFTRGLSVGVDDHLADTLASIAMCEGVTISQVTRDLILAGLKERGVN